MIGLVFAVTPFGVLFVDIEHPAMPFVRRDVVRVDEIGEIWDSLPRAVQRELEADGIDRRRIEEPLTSDFYRALARSERGAA